MWIVSIACVATRGGQAATDARADAPAPRAVSAHTAELLTIATRRLEAKQTPATSAPVAPSRIATDRPANEIVRLPNYIVREPKLPQREDVLVDAELAQIGMNRYIGLVDGLDRGWLNRFTIKSVWNKIPVLGKFPLLGFETNEERGLRLYREEKMKEEWEGLTSLLSPALKPKAGDTPAPTTK